MRCLFVLFTLISTSPKIHNSRTPRRLGLDHLIGTPALKPYMHGYFLSLNLYDTARVIANPFAYAEHREKLVKERMEKMAETRIRAKKGTGTGVGGEEVKVNKALAERIERGLEKERKKEERKKRRGAKGGEDEEAMDVDVDVDTGETEQTPAELEKPTLLNDPRFKDLFLNPEFAVDETTREYALLHPSASGSKQKVRGKTAVEEEEEESERASSAGISEDESESEGDDGEEGGDSDDSSDAGGEFLVLFPSIFFQTPIICILTYCRLLSPSHTHMISQNSTNSTHARVQAKRTNALTKHIRVRANATDNLTPMSISSLLFHTLQLVRTQGRQVIKLLRLDSGGMHQRVDPLTLRHPTPHRREVKKERSR